MKKTLILSVLATCLLSALSGCVVVPARPVYYAPASVHVSYWH